ncbi:T9SS type A sorting domain-containing protein [Psychroserpens sp. MEBiC05023]
MLKKISTIIILCFVSVTNAQEVEIIDGLFNPLGLVLNNDELFICEHAASNIGQGKISKINLSETTPTKIELITNLIYPRAICQYGNDLYFSNSNLYKFDINDVNPTAEQILTVGTTYALIEIDDFLYIAGNNSISKIDLTSTNPSLINVINNLSDRPLAFAYRDGFLYFGYSNKVAKIDPTQTNPVPEMVVENLVSNIYSLIFYEDILLIGMSLASKISKVDFNQDPLIVEDFVDTNIGRPASFAIWNDNLYIAGGIDGNIFRIENLNTVLSLKEEEPFLALSMYPNPSSEKLNILGLDDRFFYEILDSNGKLVLKNQNNDTNTIDISDLSSGIYHIKLYNDTSKKQVLKFIKR